jgi:pyruvate,water dikinase
MSMLQSPKSIVWFNEVGKNNVPLVGGKGANLGEMISAGIPVPPGFIVTANAYSSFIAQYNLTSVIKGLLDGLDRNNSKLLNYIATQIKQTILNSKMPSDLVKQIEKFYEEMDQGLVAVRSSATAEDLAEASFAGQQSTFLNVEGANQVVEAVKKCWASLFESRAIYYREEQHFDHLSVAIAVPVQKMIQSETSGVIFTIEPITSDPTKVVIESIYGLGEGLVSGEIKPDFYIVDKNEMVICHKELSTQEKYLARDLNSIEGNSWQQVQPSKQDKQKTKDEDVIKLAELAIKIEKYYGNPQDIEWAQENGNIYIVQSRPVTAIKETTEEIEPDIKAPTLLVGAPASPGLASGPVKILFEPSEIDRVEKGDILVAEMTTPDFVPAMKRAAAIVTDRGGRTSHAAIVSRELGIPCVVGVGEATRMLKDSQVITVDGAHGKVYKGKITRRINTTSVASIIRETIKTQTKVYVNLAQPELADRIAARNVDGVGLLRAEFIVGQIGYHPSYMIKENRESEYIQKLYTGIKAFTHAFNPRPVVYRTTDFKTNEYRELKGGDEFEQVEENPMIGYRGASRYISDKKVFKMELEAIKKVRKEYKNLWVMIPFVRTVNELQETKKIMEEEGLYRSSDFKLWMMVEVPSNILLLEQFIDAGIDGISIGSNDLTQLILGIDRDSEKLRDTFNEQDDAVMVALERAVKIAKEKSITSSICGQAPSVYPELTEKLVALGITSVSISPDMIGTTREIIAKAEAKLKGVV